MEPTVVTLVLVTILLAVGAFHLLPPIVEQIIDIIKRVLVHVADFIKWYRIWKEDLWPPAKKSA
jgi:hypothetical protein